MKRTRPPSAQLWNLAVEAVGHGKRTGRRRTTTPPSDPRGAEPARRGVPWVIVGVTITIVRVVVNHAAALHRWVDRRGTPWWTNGASGLVGAHFGSLAWIDHTSFRTDGHWVTVALILLAMTSGGIVGLSGMAGNGRYAFWSTWSLGVSALLAAGLFLPAAGLLFMTL